MCTTLPSLSSLPLVDDNPSSTPSSSAQQPPPQPPQPPQDAIKASRKSAQMTQAQKLAHFEMLSQLSKATRVVPASSSSASPTNPVAETTLAAAQLLEKYRPKHPNDTENAKRPSRQRSRDDMCLPAKATTTTTTNSPDQQTDEPIEPTNDTVSTEPQPPTKEKEKKERRGRKSIKALPPRQRSRSLSDLTDKPSKTKPSSSSRRKQKKDQAILAAMDGPLAALCKPPSSSSSSDSAAAKSRPKRSCTTTATSSTSTATKPIAPSLKDTLSKSAHHRTMPMDGGGDDDMSTTSNLQASLALKPTIQATIQEAMHGSHHKKASAFDIAKSISAMATQKEHNDGDVQDDEPSFNAKYKKPKGGEVNSRWESSRILEDGGVPVTARYGDLQQDLSRALRKPPGNKSKSSGSGSRSNGEEDADSDIDSDMDDSEEEQPDEGTTKISAKGLAAHLGGGQGGAANPFNMSGLTLSLVTDHAGSHSKDGEEEDDEPPPLTDFAKEEQRTNVRRSRAQVRAASERGARTTGSASNSSKLGESFSGLVEERRTPRRRKSSAMALVKDEEKQKGRRSASRKASESRRRSASQTRASRRRSHKDFSKSVSALSSHLDKEAAAAPRPPRTSSPESRVSTATRNRRGASSRLQRPGRRSHASCMLTQTVAALPGGLAHLEELMSDSDSEDEPQRQEEETPESGVADQEQHKPEEADKSEKKSKKSLASRVTKVLGLGKRSTKEVKPVPLEDDGDSERGTDVKKEDETGTTEASVSRKSDHAEASTHEEADGDAASRDGEESAASGSKSKTMMNDSSVGNITSRRPRMRGDRTKSRESESSKKQRHPKTEAGDYDWSEHAHETNDRRSGTRRRAVPRTRSKSLTSLRDSTTRQRRESTKRPAGRVRSRRTSKIHLDINPEDVEPQ